MPVYSALPRAFLREEKIRIEAEKFPPRRLCSRNDADMMLAR
jgi:hypothetical protein